MKQSSLFTLNWNDLVKGLIMAVTTPVVFLIQQTIENGKLVFNWQQIGMAAVAGGLAYLAKNFLTPAQPVKEVTKTDDGTVTKTVVKTDSVDVTAK
jgi:hypothetical protein